MGALGVLSSNGGPVIGYPSAFSPPADESTEAAVDLLLYSQWLKLLDGPDHAR